MINNYLKKVYFLLFFLVPISLIAGAAVSLINIIFLILIFLLFSLKDLKRNFLYNSEIVFLITLYFYLIFNSFIAVDFETSALRNFGFIRYIILFIIINYFFYKFKKADNIFIFWFLILVLVASDSYLEFFTGKNILGYGEKYGERIVSFFKDEPIVGAYINGFIFIIVGFLFDKFFNKDLKSKILLISVIIFLFIIVLLTGERSNGIKVLIGFTLFFILNQNLNLKIKIITFLTISILFLSILLNSNYLKNRYYTGFIYHFTDRERLSSFIEGQQYFELYRSGLEIFKDYPFFGVGNKNYRVITSKYEGIRENYASSNHPHQIYIELLSEHGGIGTIIILSIIFALMFRHIKIIILSKNSVQIGCFVYLIINFLPLLPSGSFFSDFPSTLFWLNLSIMYACNQKTNIFNSK